MPSIEKTLRKFDKQSNNTNYERMIFSYDQEASYDKCGVDFYHRHWFFRWKKKENGCVGLHEKTFKRSPNEFESLEDCKSVRVGHGSADMYMISKVPDAVTYNPENKTCIAWRNHNG